MNDEKLIQGVRISFWTPFFITIACCFFECVHFAVQETEIDFLTGLNDILRMVISYFFPTFMAAAVTALLACFKDKLSYSGIKPGREWCLFVFTFIYGVLYIAYLMIYDKLGVVIAFSVISVLYVVLVILGCVDPRVSIRKKTLKVKNTPN